MYQTLSKQLEIYFFQELDMGFFSFLAYYFELKYLTFFTKQLENEGFGTV
jgi:hypothetical protein